MVAIARIHLVFLASRVSVCSSGLCLSFTVKVLQLSALSDLAAPHGKMHGSNVTGRAGIEG